MLQVPGSDPNNPLVYTFQYYPQSGLLQTVTLLTGASTTYTYGCSDYPTCFNSFLSNPVTGKQITWYDQADGGNTRRTENWSYSWSITNNWNVFTKVAPDGGRELTYLAGLLGTLTGPAEWGFRGLLL
jgi:hypothetical protein